MKIKRLLTIPLLLGILGGCGDDDGDQDELVTNPTTSNETATDALIPTNGQIGGQQQGDSSYNFTHFDLDVEYANDVSYNVEYTSNQNQITAELEDEINHVNAFGDDAYNQFAPYLKQLTFDEKTEDQEVLNQVMTAFGLEENFTEFELEVKFQNGKAKEYKFRK